MSSSPSVASRAAQDEPSSTSSRNVFVNASRALVHHLKKHVGVGIICAVAYFDPGNWSVDLQAGSNFGYRPMLFVILMAGLGAIVLQTLACKLGCVTGLDLASHCRLLLHDHPRHPRLVRRLVLYPLYVLSEIAIISTDLAELLGSAIGLCLIFPKLPLWAGVVLTAVDVLIFLSFSDPSKGRGRPVRIFEYTIIGLVLAVFACFVALLVKAKPDWSQVFIGYLPDKNLFKSRPDAVYAAVGILGATVMPHALFLGSSLAAQDRVSDAPSDLPSSVGVPLPFAFRISRYFRTLFRISRAERAASTTDYRSKYGERENNSLKFIRQHLYHGIADVITSLVALAVPINSAILILAAAVFYNGPDQKHDAPAGLFEAHALIKARIGSAAAFLFAIALICAGQSSSITVTLAGQIISEGFIEWKVSPFLRRLITRLISLVPSVAVAVAVGRDGINALLIASQVLLSVVLPFVAFPLIYLTSKENVMRARKPPLELVVETTSGQESTTTPRERRKSGESDNAGGAVEIDVVVEKADLEAKAEVASIETSEFVDFSNGRCLVVLAYTIWSIVLVANAYAIVILFLT